MAGLLRLLPLILLLLLPFAVAPSRTRFLPADANFVASTCRQTARPDYCISTLNTVKRSVNATTVAELAGIALEIAVSDASDTLSAINGIADQNPGTALEEHLHMCAQLYGNAIENMHDAQGDFSSQNYAGAASLVSDAGDAPDSCEGVFNGNLKSPVTDKNQNVKNHCDLAWNLLDLLS